MASSIAPLHDSEAEQRQLCVVMRDEELENLVGVTPATADDVSRAVSPPGSCANAASY